MQGQPELVTNMDKGKEEPKQLRPPDTITLPWLVRHMSLGGWLTIVGVLSAVFIGGLKVPFLPIAEDLGVGVPNEITRLNDKTSNLSSKLLESNLRFSEEVKKVRELSNERSKTLEKIDFLDKKNKHLDLELSQTKLLLSEKEKQHKEALKKQSKFQVSPRSTKSPVIKSVKVVSENFFMAKSGNPWISPDFDVTLSLIVVSTGNRLTFRATPWSENTTFSIGDIFDLPTSSGLYRFIITKAAFFTNEASLKVLKIDNSVKAAAMPNQSLNPTR